jgi:tetratricopeptide (TPR) repeat protein
VIESPTVEAAPSSSCNRNERSGKKVTASPREDPVSRRVTTTLAWSAAHRQTAPGKLSGLVRGELDWITMKALEKDRRRRYETANDFAADVVRYLTDQPVEACPPSFGYRLRKLVRRNRASLTAAVLVAVALSTGTAVSAWQAVRATWAEQRTANALAEAQDQRHEAQRKAGEAAAVTDFLVRDLLAQASPTRSQGRELTVLEAMDRAEKATDDRFADQPLIEAAIRHAVAQGYIEMSRFSVGERHARWALALRLQHLGPDHAETLESMALLAGLLHAPLHRNAEARDLCQQAIEGRRRVLGPEHEETIQSRVVLGNILRDLGEFDASRGMHESTYDLARRVLGPNHTYTLEAMIGLGLVHWRRNEPAKAQTLFEAVLAIRRRAARPDPGLLQWSLLTVGFALWDQGKFEEAERVNQEALEVGIASTGLDTRHTELALANLIGCLAPQKKGGALRALHEHWMRRLEGSDALPGGGVANHLTGERLGAAIDHLVWAELQNAPLLADREACLRAAKRAADLQPNRSFARTVLALAHAHLGRHDEAIAAAAGEPVVLNEIARFLATAPELQLRDPARAVVLARHAVAKQPVRDNWKTLGVALYRADEWKAAIEALRKSMELGNGGGRFDWFLLAMAHWQLGQKDEARTWYDTAATGMEKDNLVGERGELIRFRAEAAALLGVQPPRAEAKSK